MELVPVSDGRALVERAVTHTRKNAQRQLVFVVPLVALLVLFSGVDLLQWILIAINAITMAVMGRRIWRLRRKSPVVRALLDAPEEVGHITAWPHKLAAGQLPLMLEIHTRSQDTCSLLLDPRDPAATHALVAALQERSPDAIVRVPLLPAATLPSAKAR